MIVYPTFYIDVLLLTYLDICPGVGIVTVVQYMYVCMYCLLLTRMHENMLFYICDTYEYSDFQVYWVNVGSYDN